MAKYVAPVAFVTVVVGSYAFARYQDDLCEEVRSACHSTVNNLYRWWNAGQLSLEEEKTAAALVCLVDTDPEADLCMETFKTLAVPKGRRRAISTPFTQGAVNEARAKLGYLKDTADNRRVVITTLLRIYKEKNVRAFDVSRHLPLAEELFFVPTEAQLEKNALARSAAVSSRRAEEAEERNPAMDWSARWNWLFGRKAASSKVA